MKSEVWISCLTFFLRRVFFVPVQSHEDTHMTGHYGVGFVVFVRRSFTQCFRYLD